MSLRGRLLWFLVTYVTRMDVTNIISLGLQKMHSVVFMKPGPIVTLTVKCKYLNMLGISFSVQSKRTLYMSEVLFALHHTRVPQQGMSWVWETGAVNWGKRGLVLPALEHIDITKQLWGFMSHYCTPAVLLSDGYLEQVRCLQTVFSLSSLDSWILFI